MANFVNEETVRKWRTRPGRVQPEAARTVQRIGVAMLTLSRRHMDEEIYSIPEDRTKSGKPKWQRTGNLRAGEALEFAGDGSGVTLTNKVVYAEARHELGRDGRKTKRRAHWRDTILQELRDVVQREVQIMNRRIFEGR